MENQSIFLVVQMKDGSVSIVEFLTQTRIIGEPTLEDHWTEIKGQSPWCERKPSPKNIVDELKRTGLDFVNYQVVKTEDLPSREFREAWDYCPVQKVKINMDKARVIHMGKIRAARNAALEELDKRKYGASYDGLRENLRNLPVVTDLSKAETIDQLKEIWPKLLERVQ